MTGGRISPPWVIVLLAAFVVASLDQFTKYLIVESIGPGTNNGPIVLIPDLLELQYVENTGAAFGLFRDSTAVLAVISLIVVTFLALMFRGMISKSRLLGLAFGMQFGGALGNLIDRVRLGYVVDFIDVPNWPTFNVADSGITVGVAVLAFVLLIRPEWVAPGEDEQQEGSRDQETRLATSRPDTAGDVDTKGSISRDSGT